MDKNDKRFERVFKQGGMSSNSEIWVDTQNGVQYLWHCGGYSGGLTVLVDAEGKLLLYHKGMQAPEF